MKIYKNISGTPLRFGRFKLGAGETVPAIPYTASEEKDILRFVIKGLLSEEGAANEVAEAVPEPVAVEEAPSEDTTEVQADEDTTEDTAEVQSDEGTSEDPEAPKPRKTSRKTK